MPTTGGYGRRARTQSRDMRRPAPAFVAAVAAAVCAGVAAAAIGWLAPPLVLPVVSAMLIAVAALAALLALLAPAGPAGLLSYWDVSGAFTFLGIGAALLSEPDAVLPLLESGIDPGKTDN